MQTDRYNLGACLLQILRGGARLTEHELMGELRAIEGGEHGHHSDSKVATLIQMLTRNSGTDQIKSFFATLNEFDLEQPNDRLYLFARSLSGSGIEV